MPLVLGFAESSNASEPIFASGTGRSLGTKEGWVGSEGARKRSADVGVERLLAGPDL